MVAFAHDEDLLVARAHVFHPEQPGGGLEGEGEGIAEPSGPDVVGVGPGPVRKGVVVHRRAVEIGAADLGGQGGEIGQHAGAVTEIADSPVDLAVRAKADGPTVVVRSDGGQSRHNGGLVRADVSDGRVADDLLLARRDGGKDVELLIDQEVGVERDSDQSTLARLVDGRHGGEGRGQEEPVLDHQDRAILAGDEQPIRAVGRPGQAGGARQLG